MNGDFALRPLPCPFCGTAPRHELPDSSATGTDRVWCPHCGVTLAAVNGTANPYSSLTRWNLRLQTLVDPPLLPSDRGPLPCPFCGGRPLHYVGNPHARQTDALHCLRCGIFASGNFDPNSAMSKWNRRADRGADASE